MSKEERKSGRVQKIRLFTVSLFTHPKEKAGRGVFCAGVQFSCDYIRVFDNGIKIRENRGL